MSRWGALAILLAFAGALAFRAPQLATRPLHNDEAVNAVKVADLWAHDRFAYDPDEYHGPTLHYFSLPFLWLSGASGPNDLPDRVLRLMPVFFGAALIFLLPLFRDGLGWHAVAWAALFTSISPAMVFYSRYFIHEILLIFFTALAIGSGWRYAQSPSPWWALSTGAAVGFMFATKETFVLSLGAMGLAALITLRISRVNVSLSRVNWRDVALALGGMAVVWFLFFSSFLSNFAGLLDSVVTYFPWLKRAAGHSPHIHPWYFYLQRLAWFHPGKGPAWSEGLILVLALLGGASAFRKNRSPLLRFIAIYTVVLTALYSAISYKTPWCLLNFFFGMILLAGAGAAQLIERFRARPVRMGMAALVLACAGQLAVQAWRASFVYSSDRRNPYVYAQTVPDLLNLAKRADGLGKSSADGFKTVVKVIAPESDYWPLPWYLRRFENVGWYDKVPDDPFAPIVIAASSLDARLDEKSNRKWIMAGVTELRPGKFLELYVEIGLWTKYVETLPPEPD